MEKKVGDMRERERKKTQIKGAMASSFHGRPSPMHTQSSIGNDQSKRKRADRKVTAALLENQHTRMRDTHHNPTTN